MCVITTGRDKVRECEYPGIMQEQSSSEVIKEYDRMFHDFLQLLNTDLKMEPVSVQEYFQILAIYIRQTKSKSGVHTGVLTLLNQGILYSLVELALGKGSMYVYENFT